MQTHGKQFNGKFILQQNNVFPAFFFCFVFALFPSSHTFHFISSYNLNPFFSHLKLCLKVCSFMVVTLIENVFKRLIYGSLIEVEVKLCKFYNRFIKIKSNIKR